MLHGGGGDYLRVTPTGSGRHTVSRYGSDNKLQYSTSNAQFEHDSESGSLKWSGGQNHGGMGGSGSLKSFGGNIEGTR